MIAISFRANVDAETVISNVNHFHVVSGLFHLLFFTMQDEADGSNEYNNFQRGALNTTKRLIQDLKNIDIVFHIGDICYANGYLSQWDQFTAQVEPIASTVPYMIARLSLFEYITYLSKNSSFSKFGSFFFLSVATMNATGQDQVLSMGTWTQEENVVCWLKICSMFPPRTTLSSGMGFFLHCDNNPE